MQIEWSEERVVEVRWSGQDGWRRKGSHLCKDESMAEVDLGKDRKKMSG